jgi:glycosyltransferase involved in cell wall biosynthesis
MAKVCFLTSVHDPFDTRVFHREACSLAAAGYQVVLMAPHKSNGTFASGVEVCGLPIYRKRIYRILNWVRLIRFSLEQNADIYHFHDPELIGVGLLLKILLNASVIYDVHEHNPDAIRERHWIPRFLRPILSWLYDRLEVFVSRFFDAVITADDEVAKRFQGKASRLVTLFNFPRKDLYSNLIPKSSPDGCTRIAYVGVLGRSRGLWLMMRAVELLVRDYQDDVKLTLAGRIPDKREREQFLERMVMQPILSKRIEWLGRISQGQVAEVLGESNIGWVPLSSNPKFQKNIPTKLFEYMASGLPIVASDLQPIRKFVDVTNTGYLVAPNDPKAHAEAIHHLIHSPEKMKNMGQRGRQAFLEVYNWDSESMKLIELYRNLLKIRL